jgi:superfamily II DNA/RNA helicase
LRLNHVGFLVLDEADRMLDMGFIHDIRKIVAKLPTERQTLFFSATMPQQIADLARQMLRDPVKVAVTPAATTVERVAQRVIHVDRAGKAAMLADLLRGETVERTLVFTRTKHGADKVVRGLVKSGIAAQAIHGNKSQSQRERVLAEFRTGKIRTLIATDIAARGIDVDGISHVINYDLPNEPESYVHRIGRTARAGATGIAISLCDAEEAPYLRAIEKLIRLSIPSEGYRASAHRPQQAAGPREGRPNGHRPQGGRPQGQQARGGHSPNNGGHPRGNHAAGSHPHGRPAEGGHRNKRHRPQRGGQGGPSYGERPRHAHQQQPESHGRTAGQDVQGIGGVGFLQRPVPARRDDAGRPPR